MKAIAKTVKMSPRKIRLVVDAVRGLSIEDALKVLGAMQKRASAPVIKTIESAVANAVVNNGADQKNLVIASISVNEGQAMKRFHPSSRGRVHPFKKKSSHISVILNERKHEEAHVSKEEKSDKIKVVEKVDSKKDEKIETKGGAK